MGLNTPTRFEQPIEESLRNAVIRRAGLSEGRLGAIEPEAAPGENAAIALCDSEIRELIKQVGWRGPEDLVRHGHEWKLSDVAMEHILIGQGFEPQRAQDIVFAIERRKN